MDFEKIGNAAQGEVSRAQLDSETLLTMGGAAIRINNLEVPPPTTAVLSLLEIIDSPFLLLSGRASLRQVVETLYVICERERAVMPLLRFSRARRMIDETSKIAVASPEFYEKYLNSMASARKDMQEFDSNVSKFGESLGVFDIAKAANEIKEYIYASMGGFEMIPDSGEGQDKKKESSTVNGSPA